ncbi:MAG: chaperone modulator CbpM [Janthinobacterium lividum]
MITLNAVLERVRGVDADTLLVWITQEWVRPLRREGQPVFEEVDVARVRLIVEMRDELQMGEAAIPVVLSLLDELHATRRDMRRLADVMRQARRD